MAKYCIKCGIEIPHGAKYCANCGKRTQPLKKTTKKIIVISIILIIAIITSVALFLILQDDTSKFYGTWKVEYSTGSSSIGMLWTFYENASIKMISSYSYDQSPTITCDQNSTYITEEIVYNTLTVNSVSPSSGSATTQWSTFEIKDGELYMSPLSTGIGGIYGFDYDFSNDNRITLGMASYPMVLTLTRTSESAINQTQQPETIEWNNINISLYELSNINYNWINLTRSSTPYYNERCPSEWGNVKVGDILEIGTFDSYVSASMRWVPTEEHIGNWYFNYS